MRFSGPFVGFFTAFLAVACVSDHDALARRDSPGTGGSGGSGGTKGGKDGGGDASPGDAAADHGDAWVDAGDDAGSEPDGTNRLTLFHGAVDAPRLAFCAVRVAEGGAEAAIEPIFPETGLKYATPLVLDGVPGIDVASDALRLIAVAIDASLPAPRCADVLAELERGPADAGARDAAPPLRAAGLPVLPPGTLSSARSLLLVVTGCFGGPDHDGPALETVCGRGYTPEKPTLGIALAAMSRRTASGRFGLQLFHGSRGTETVGLVTSPPAGIVGPSYFVASEVRYGQIAPRFANVAHARLEYGAPFEDALLEIRREAPEGVNVTWREAMLRGGVSAPADGANFTIVFVGPLPGTSEPWANPATLTVVASDPK